MKFATQIVNTTIALLALVAFGKAQTFRGVRSIASDEATNPSNHQKQIVSPDLALHGHVTVSSTYKDWEIYDAYHLVDGDSGSRWTSSYSDDQIIDIDLGGRFPVGMVRLRWESAHAESYQLLLSLDGDSWTTVQSTDKSAGGFEELIFQSQEARFVRLNLLKRATSYGFSLWDFEVYKAPALQEGVNSAPSIGLPEPTTPNLADWDTNTVSDVASVSTVYKDWDIYQISHIVDGNSETRWASERHDNQKVYVDLEEVHSIDRVRIGWEAAHAKSYELWLSEDGMDWTIVYSTDNCGGGFEDIAFDSQQARYVHLNLLTQATQFGFSIWDLEIYGPESEANMRPVPSDQTIGGDRAGDAQAMDEGPVQTALTTTTSTKSTTTCLKKGVICWDSPQADRNPCNTCCDGYKSIPEPSWAGQCQ